MNRVLGCLILLLLTSCATNDRPAEVISPSRPVTKPTQLSEYYLVKPGDTLESVSRNFAISEANLLKLNNLREGFVLVPGQRLIVKPRNKFDEQKLLESPKPMDETHGTSAEETSLADQTVEVISSQPVARESVMSSANYRLPVQGRIIKSFGKQSDGSFNKGINISAPKGVPVKAISDGVVKYAGSNAAEYGKMVMMKHGDGKISTYAHLNTIDVKKESMVSAGSKIGTVGSTGNVSQPQLNLQIRSADKSPIDPSSVLSGLG